MTALYVTAIILCLIGLLIRTSYESLKQAGKIDTHNKIVFAIVFLGMSLLLMSWPLMSMVDPQRIYFPGFMRLIGMLVVWMGLCLAVGGVLQLKGVENIENLVTTGLYSKLRHPMYSGFLLWIIGWTVIEGSIIGILLGTVCILNIFYWRHLEEGNLEIQFGDEYRKYKNSTWF